MKRNRIFPRVILLLAILSLCFAATATAAQDDLTHVRLGMTPFQDMLAIVVGDEQGIYEQVGIDLEFIHLPYEAVTEAVAAGSLDLGSICETTVVTSWDAFPHQRLGNSSIPLKARRSWCALNLACQLTKRISLPWAIIPRLWRRQFPARGLGCAHDQRHRYGNGRWRRVSRRRPGYHRCQCHRPESGRRFGGFPHRRG